MTTKIAFRAKAKCCDFRTIHQPCLMSVHESFLAKDWPSKFNFHEDTVILQ